MTDSGEAKTSRGLFGSASLVSLATSLSRVGGLIREQIFAALLGAGFYSDAFVVAYRVPNLLRDLLAEGALSTAFVPTFTDTLLQEGKQRAFALGNLVLTTLFVVTFGIVVMGIVFAEPLVRFIAPGFVESPGKIELTVLLTRILFPFLTLVALAAVLMGMLNSQQRFFLPAVAPALFNAAAIVVGLTLFWAAVETRTAVLWWAAAVLIGGLLQMAVQAPGLLRLGWRYRPRFSFYFRDPGLRRILRLMAPAIVGLSATQINILVNNILASQLEQGSPSWINYAFRLMQLPIGVFGVAVATVNLAAISRDASHNDMESFRDHLGASLKLVAYLTLPATAGLLFLREGIIGLLYEHGRFNAYDTLQTAAVLSMYAVGLYAYASVKVLAPAFYALRDTRVPMLASIVAVATNIIANLLLYQRMGAPGLALGTSLGAWVNVTILYVSFRRRYGPLQESALVSQILRVLAAAVAMGVLCRWLWQVLRSLLGDATWQADVVVTLTPVGAGILFYFMLSLLLRLNESKFIVERLRRR